METEELIEHILRQKHLQEMMGDRLWSEWSTKGFYEDVAWSNSKL